MEHDVERLYREYSPVMKKWLRRKAVGVRRESYIEDAVQHAFLRLIERPPDRAARGWLCIVALNYLRRINRYRPDDLSISEIRRGPSDERLGFELPRQFACPESLEDRLIREDRDRYIRRKIQALPKRLQDATTCWMEDSTIPEASKALRLTEGAVKSRLFRARSLLRRSLAAVA